jgi:serine/threonine-protein kinase
LNSENALEPGSVFGRYEIVRLIGEGGMGAVYEALHRELHKPFAIKILQRSISKDETQTARFLREGRTASRIRHPHVVDVVDVSTLDGVVFMVMELLEGESLADCIAREGALGVARTAQIMLPVCSAVSAAHDEGIVHRDLKPENIFLSRQHRGAIVPKIVDFGISKVTTLSQNIRLTNTGAMLGTPLYMAPEQARGADAVDALADQYSLGMVLYECVTGRVPFESDSFLALIHEISKGITKRPRAYRPDLPVAFENAILRATHVDPAARFPSVRDLGTALLEFTDAATRARWAGEFSNEAERVSSPGITSDSSRDVSGTAATAQGAPSPAGVFAKTVVDEGVAVTTEPGSARAPRRSAWVASIIIGMAAISTLIVLAVRRQSTPLSPERRAAHATVHVQPDVNLSPPTPAQDPSIAEPVADAGRTQPAIGANSAHGSPARPAHRVRSTHRSHTSGTTNGQNSGNAYIVQ